MRTPRHRVLEKVYTNGRRVFIPQYRFLWVWMNCKNEALQDVTYSTLEEAQIHIRYLNYLHTKKAEEKAQTIIHLEDP